jgi:predicted nucleic acid-binding protein
VIVIDASAALDLLLLKPNAPALESRVLRSGEQVHAPHLIDLEVAQVLRRHAHIGDLTGDRAGEALQDWLAFPVARHVHDLLLPRVWELRDSISAYDAIYVALAETLGAPLVTADAKLARAHGHRASVEVFAA